MYKGPPIHWYTRDARGRLGQIACGTPTAPGRFTLDPEKTSCRKCIVSDAGAKLDAPARANAWDCYAERAELVNTEPPWDRAKRLADEKLAKAERKKAREAARRAKAAANAERKKLPPVAPF